MKISQVKFKRPRVGLSAQTAKNARSLLGQLVPGGGRVAMDVVDADGLVCHVHIFMDKKGGLWAAKGSHDPRSLEKRLTRNLRLRSLTLATKRWYPLRFLQTK